MVILLTGPDSYRSLRRLEQLRTAFRAKHDPSGLNTITLDAETATVASIRDALMSNGLFAARRMVLLDPYDPKRAALKPAAVAEVLAPHATSETPIVIIRQVGQPTTDRRKRAAVATLNVPKAKSEDFPVLGPAEGEGWLVKQATERGGAIAVPAARRLVAEAEGDTWRLSTELDKLLTYVSGRTISVEDIEQMTAAGRVDSDVFAFIDAVGQRRRDVALRLLHQELSAGTNALSLVAALTRHIEHLINALALQPAAPAVVAQKLGIHPFVASKAVAQARQFKRPDLIRWHEALYTIDRQLKSTPLDAETLLMLFVGGL